MNDDIQVLDTGQDTDTSTYTPYEVIGFENGTLVTPASADLETGAVTMPVYSGKAPINATNLNHLEQGLKDLETYILTGGSVFGGNNPIGSISLWNTNTPPVGYLICDGTTYSKSQYPDLYDALGSDYQISAEQFKVPDFRGLIPIGAGIHQDANSKSKTFTLGTEYGEYEHTQTINEMPVHNHTSNNEQFSTALTPKTRINTGGTESGVANNPTGYTGGGQPFNVMQPSLTVNFIIKAVKSNTTLAEVENSLTSDSTTNAPSINAVNNLVNWKEGNSGTGQTSVSLPESFYELYIVLEYNDLRSIFFIPKISIPLSGSKLYREGYYISSGQTAGTGVRVSLTEAYINDFTQNGTDQKNNATIKIYYR